MAYSQTAYSVQSTSTIGGISYDDLCKGTKKYYSFNLVDLVDDNSQPIPFEIAARILIEKVNSTLDDIITQQPDKVVEEFTIGKSHARRMKKGAGGYRHFNRLDPNTWKLDGGVNGRWRYYSSEKDYDGLVALTAITNDIIPAYIKNAHEFIGVEQYSIALEQALIQHFALYEPDPRLGNQSFNTGKESSNPFAGVVYVAFKLRDIPRVYKVENY